MWVRRELRRFFAARVIVGLGESALSPAAISLISDYFPPARRGLAVGSFLCGIAIGQGAAILIGGTTCAYWTAGGVTNQAAGVSKAYCNAAPTQSEKDSLSMTRIVRHELRA